MRRLLAIVAAAAVALAGCGSASSPRANAQADALGSELSYFDAGSPFVLSLTTSSSAASVQRGNALLGQFPLAGFGRQELLSRLQQIGIDYATDVKPLLGHPITIGIDASDPVGAAAHDLLLVWQTGSAAKLQALVHKIPGLQSHGVVDGARLFSLGTLQLALAGPTAVFATTASELQAALARHAHGGGFSAGEASRLTAGLPAQPLVEAMGNLEGVLSTPRAAKARRVPWVAALRGYAVAIDPGSSNLTLDYRLDTAGQALSTGELPIAAGDTAPTLAGTAPISAGLTDPAQTVRFLLGVTQLTKPRELARLTPRGRGALDALLGQLTGDANVSSDTHTTVACVHLADPARARSELATLIAGSRGAKPRALGGGFYRTKTLTIGVGDGQLLLGRATVAELKAFARAPTARAPGALGSVAFRIALPALLRLTMPHAAAGPAAAVLSQLGYLTGWARASPTALSGVATLALK